MPSDPVERYKALLAKEQRENDEYVLVDAKWLGLWKRFVGIEPAEENTQAPGQMDFTKLVDPNTVGHPDGVQLRSDALEGNDYTFIPAELYRELTEKFGQLGKEIVRRVIPTQTDGYITVIETFLVPLRLCASRLKLNTAQQIYRSRRTKVADLKHDIRSRFSLIETIHHRLMSAIDESGEKWEPVDDGFDLVLADIELTKNAFVIYESAAVSARHTSTYVAPPGALYTPGLCGLSNLGNTCFMNSALQCLSNVPALTKYFLGQEYIDHINRDNPLGMKGDVAQAYGELIANMWSGRTNYYTPKTLKQSVARYAPQFSGYNQQDSQEFMSFLLDGLHEDLNRVKQKPYVAKKDEDKSKADPELAREHWEDYLKRNQSKIHEIFHGQIKSVVQCLTCKERGRTFDPICFLSLPLPDKKKIRTFKIDYVRLDGSLKTYYIKSNEHGRMRNLVQDFCKRFQKKDVADEQPEPMEEGENGAMQPAEEPEKEEEEEDLTKAEDYDGHQPHPDSILSAEIYNSRIYSQYKDETFLTNVLERDRVVFYQTPNSLKGANIDTILMPCVFRSTDNYRSNFGLPFYVNIPRKNCKGKDIEEALKGIIDKFLPLSAVGTSDTPLYTASLIMNYNYSQKTKSLASVLDEVIDFSHTNTSLTIDVAQSVVSKYEELEKRKLAEVDRLAASQSSGVQTRSQKKLTSTSLIDCFKHFTTKEILSDDDLWFCPQCKALKKASKKIDLWRLPKVLIVQLKRFNYNAYFRDKIDLLVECPIDGLDLAQYVQNPEEKANTKYNLIAVSNHMGGLGGGHYTAHARNMHDQRWHTFDDGYVSNVDANNVIGKSAYVLIYEQQPAPSDRRPGSALKGASNH